MHSRGSYTIGNSGGIVRAAVVRPLRFRTSNGAHCNHQTKGSLLVMAIRLRSLAAFDRASGKTILEWQLYHWFD